MDQWEFKISTIDSESLEANIKQYNTNLTHKKKLQKNYEKDIAACMRELN